MELLVIYAATLLVAVLLSGWAERSVMSAAVLFLFAGYLFGQPSMELVSVLSTIALFTVLFTDGMHVSLQDLRSAWRLPGRALFFGMPLTLVGTALLAHYVAELSWLDAFLVGAVLSPTDPVLAAAIVGRETVPHRLGHLLNVESGLNDGLALPVVIGLLAAAGDQADAPSALAIQMVLGLALGIAIPWIALKLEGSKFFESSQDYYALNAFAIGLLLFAITEKYHANEFLAAFFGGITVATVSPMFRDAFHEFGSLVAELLKFLAILVFGALISIEFLQEIPQSGYIFAALALFVVRPVALAFALIGTKLTLKEWVAASWFGPKGFASVVYGLLIVQSGHDTGDQLFHLIAIVVVSSIVLHSSTDVLVAKWFESHPIEEGEPSHHHDVVHPTLEETPNEEPPLS